MKRITIATMLALALASAGLTWADSGQTKPDPDPKVGTRVTITGCLHEGTKRDSFVLLGVTERPADTPATAVKVVPYAIYWLDSTGGLKKLVGELVDITGRVTERRAKPGRITVSVDASETKNADIQVRSDKTLDVTSEPYNNRPQPAGASGADSKLEVSRPVYKLDVEKVSAVGAPVPGPPCR